MRKVSLFILFIISLVSLVGCASLAENADKDISSTNVDSIISDSISSTTVTTLETESESQTTIMTSTETIAQSIQHSSQFSSRKADGISYQFPSNWIENKQDIFDNDFSNISYYIKTDSEYLFQMFYQSLSTNSDYQLSLRMIDSINSAEGKNFIEQLSGETHGDITFSIFRINDEKFGNQFLYFAYRNQKVYCFYFSESLNEEIRNQILSSVKISNDNSFEMTTPLPENLTAGQAAALNSALAYLENEPYSEKVLREKLTADGHALADIDFAMQHHSIDFYEIAVRAAVNAMDNGDYYLDLPYTLVSEGFTDEQARNALQVVYENYEYEEYGDDTFEDAY